jgi:hypothetical protein
MLACTLDAVTVIALVAALALIVPAAGRIVVGLWPRAESTPSGRARALDAVWTVVPFALLAALIALSVVAAG